MPATLVPRQENLVYTGQFARPPFELWGAGGMLVKEIYDALVPYKVTLQNFQLSASLANAADTLITVHIGTSVLKFSFEKVEVSFADFSEEAFQGIPKFLQAATGWLSKLPNFRFASHQVLYFSHSFLKEMLVDDFLRTINPRATISAGFDLGSGATFHRSVPEKKWVTQLALDKSQYISGALYIGLSIRIESETVNYESLLVEGRAYFQGALGELGLTLPQP